MRKLHLQKRKTKDLVDDPDLLLVLVESYYHESSGYEKVGEMGSRNEYLSVYQMTEDDLCNWLLDNPTAVYKILKTSPVTVNKTISFKFSE